MKTGKSNNNLKNRSLSKYQISFEIILSALELRRDLLFAHFHKIQDHFKLNC